MHGIRPQFGVDDVRPHQFRFDRERHAVIGEAAQRIFRRQQAADAAGGIFERRFDGMPAIEQRRTVGLMNRRTELRARRRGSSFGALASRAWVWLPGFSCHRGLISCVPRLGNCPRRAESAPLTSQRRLPINPQIPTSLGRSRLSFEINTVPRLWGRVSRAAKGADCKSAGYAFVGSSPTSSTISGFWSSGR